MMHIVTGKINSGKTTTLYDLYHENEKGDGFVSVKRMHYDKVHGYDLMRLSDSKTMPFVVHQDFEHDAQDIACQIGPYLFCRKALDVVSNQVNKWIANNVSPIYLDEIGELELNNQGFHPALQACITADVATYITVREDLVERVQAKYHIHTSDIITP